MKRNNPRYQNLKALFEKMLDRLPNNFDILHDGMVDIVIQLFTTNLDYEMADTENEKSCIENFNLSVLFDETDEEFEPELFSRVRLFITDSKFDADEQQVDLEFEQTIDHPFRTTIVN